MLNEGSGGAGGAGGSGGAGGQQGAQGQGVPFTTIQVTPEEKEAIDRVCP